MDNIGLAGMFFSQTTDKASAYLASPFEKVWQAPERYCIVRIPALPPLGRSLGRSKAFPKFLLRLCRQAAFLNITLCYATCQRLLS